MSCYILKYNKVMHITATVHTYQHSINPPSCHDRIQTADNDMKTY